MSWWFRWRDITRVLRMPWLMRPANGHCIVIPSCSVLLSTQTDLLTDVITNIVHTLDCNVTYLLVSSITPSFRPSEPALCGSHPVVTPYYCRLGDLLFFLYVCIVFLCYLCSLCLPSVLWYCWLGLLTCKTVSQITYTVLVETLNTAQSVNRL